MDKTQETKKGWLQANLENWQFRRLYQRELVAESFIVRIEDAMNEQHVTKTELAKRMECSSANISRVMRKTTNMTIATMVDMALSLNLGIRITLEPLAIEDCTFAPQLKPEAAAWPTVIDNEEHTTDPKGFVVCFQVKKRPEATKCSSSGSNALWSPLSAFEPEELSQYILPTYA